jgi:peptidyl-prolyl cis-trans isomerase D
MLKMFRENLKALKWVLWLVVAVFVAAIFFDFGDFGSTIGGGGDATTAARVGSERVTITEYQRQLRQLDQQYRQIYGDQMTPELAEQLQLPFTALNSAVNQKVLLAEARRMNLVVSDEDLRKAILEIPALKDDKGNFVGTKVYETFLRDNGFTPKTFEDAIRESLQLERLQQLLRGTLYVSDAEIDDAIREQLEKAAVRYVELPRSQFLQGQEIPKAEIDAYFAANKEEYRLPEQREISYLLVDQGKVMASLQIPDADLKTYYDANLANFSHEEEVRASHVLAMVNDAQTDAAARVKIEAAKARIAAGGDFAKIATEVSEDTGSKTSGGDLGWFSKGKMVKEFEDAAFAAAPGQLVGPIKSPFGYHLIRVAEKRAGGTSAFEEVKETIRGTLSAERAAIQAEAKAKQLAERLNKARPKDTKELEEMAKQDASLSYTASNRFGRNDAITGIGANPELIEAAFALKKGEVSKAVRVPRGWTVFWLSNVYEPQIPELSEVEPRVRQAVANQKQERLALEKLAAARDKMTAGATLDQVASELGLTVKDSGEFGANGAIAGLGYASELAKAALALEVGKVGGPVVAGQGAVLFQVTDRKGLNPEERTAKMEETRRSVESEKLSRLLQALIEKRREEMGVTYSRQLLEQIGIDPAVAQATKG